MKKNKIDEELKENDSEAASDGVKEGIEKKYNLKPSFLETVSIFIFFVSLAFVIYFELEIINGYNFFIR